MTDIFCGFIEFVSGSLEELPSIEKNLGLFGIAINYINMVADFISAANFLVPVPDVFTILGFMFAVKSIKIIMWAGNWIVRRVFDVIP